MKILQTELNGNIMSVPADSTHNGHTNIAMTPWSMKSKTPYGSYHIQTWEHSPKTHTNLQDPISPMLTGSLM